MTSHAAIKAMMGPDPLALAIARGANYHRAVSGLGDAATLTPQQTAALLNLAAAYTSWKAQVLTVADGSDQYGDQLRTLVDTASRQFNKLIGGDIAMGNVMQQTMRNTMDLVSEITRSSVPSLQEAYEVTVSSLQTLVVGVASTAGNAAGAALKAAADQLGVKPADAGRGIEMVAGAIGLGALAYILFQLRMIFGRRK